MGLNVTQKILSKHLIEGDLVAGGRIAIKIDQTLTQDATGTMAHLEFEALGIPRVKTKLSVSYVDHNTMQADFKNADDHIYLQSVAAKFGIHFSRPGNGICHQVHLERFGVPGQTLLGSDSHTPTQGGVGMIAIGAGGLDVALAMAGQPFFLNCPKVLNVRLEGKLQSWVSAKDIILEVLRNLSVKGGVGKVIEYSGPALRSLTVPDRATITNMGAELGATTSVFPSDSKTKEYLKAQGREKDYYELKADKDSEYDETLVINLDNLVPMVAQPHMPDNVVDVKSLKRKKVSQVAIGSCTNSSYRDLMIVAKMLKGRTIASGLSMFVSPGSKQVYKMISDNGALSTLIDAGARVLESACGPCIGMGAAPNSEGVSVRTFNRNFIGRSGTKNAGTYLVSPETAAAAALSGELIDPRQLAKKLNIKHKNIGLPNKYEINDNLIIFPFSPKKSAKVEILRGPNIAPLPKFDALPPTLLGKVLLKTGDNVTTDDIMPAGARVLPFRSNVPAISEFVFEAVDQSFPTRAKDIGGGFVVGGSNYGQGSSREHAAIAPKYLGVKAVLVKSFARIHMANLINFGILPLTFINESDYQKIDQDDELEIDTSCIGEKIVLLNKTKSLEIPVTHSMSERDLNLMSAGGTLAFAAKTSSS
ncbi:MAG TPA: aconitate hydratase [Nitrospinota bacterium]|nr:aconitate hydratase [Nitrospinota bacterium]|tara:strand:- start:71475 stop:73415 length:1941 start_codon:yes stop_codon:yes gene_type:complete